jgi:inner membrane protein
MALHLPPAGVLAACVGAVLPDIIDMRVAGLAMTKASKQRTFNRIHRGLTHWFGWWALLLAGGVLFTGWNALHPLVRTCLMGLGFGGLSHVTLDMLTPNGVPLLPLPGSTRVSLRLCSTGSLGEYCFLAAILALSFLFLRDDALLLYHNALNLLR